MGAGAIPLQIEKAFRERARSKHKLHVFAADDEYTGDDCVDVSLHGGHTIVVPPKHLFVDYKLGRSSQAQFQKAYFEFLEQSFIQYQHTWDDLLNRDKIVLVCSCNEYGKTCQRYFLVKFLKKFGAVYKGKLKT